jgi:hypothetical protein
VLERGAEEVALAHAREERLHPRLAVALDEELEGDVGGCSAGFTTTTAGPRDDLRMDQEASPGVYWVPAPYAETLRQLQQAVSNIGASRLDVVPIHASPEATAALGDAARASIDEEITTLRAEIDGFLASPPERVSTLARHLETFEGLRAKARLYHTVLQVQVQDLETALNKLTLQVEGLLQTKAA